MRTIYQEITLKNGGDVELSKRGYLKEDEIRQATETFVIDTGAEITVITEDLFDLLGWNTYRSRPSTVAGGGKIEGRISGPVEIHWKDRCYMGEVMALPGQTENLLGNSSLEFMDLGVDTVNGTLFGIHGDQIVHMIRYYLISPYFRRFPIGIPQFHTRLPRLNIGAECSPVEVYTREDDRPEAIQQRLEVYRAQTAPLIDFYRQKGLLLDVDARPAVDQVVENFKQRLGL
jgi:clan AA aspartic protease